MAYIAFQMAFFAPIVIWPITLMLIIPLYLAPPESETVRSRLKDLVWSLWTAGACTTAYMFALIIYMGESDALMDVSWWVAYTGIVLLLFAVLISPAAAYWFRRFVAKGRS